MPLLGSCQFVEDANERLDMENKRLTRELEQSRQRYEDAVTLAGVKDAENRSLRRDADLLRETIDGLEREVKEARAELAELRNGKARMRLVVDAAEALIKLQPQDDDAMNAAGARVAAIAACREAERRSR